MKDFFLSDEFLLTIGAILIFTVPYLWQKYLDKKTLKPETERTEITPAPPPTPKPKPKLEPPPGAVLIGHSKDKRPHYLTVEKRVDNLYLLGRPNSGKSTLIRSMVLQDAIAGRGIGVIDPHGDLVAELLEMLPRSRQEDVILFSPDTKLPLNVFRAATELQKQLLADDVITLFQRIAGVPGPRMDAILRYTVRTLLEVPDATFLDINRILTDTEYRIWAVNTANIPALGNYWSNVYPSYPKDASHPILSRMGQFVLSSDLDKILGRTSSLDFYDIIQSGKILLVDLAQGKFGGETSKLLGSLIVSQFQLAAMRRVEMPKTERRPFYLYVDEFQNFKTSAFPVILSEARKYGLALTLAHQYAYQLDDETRQSVLGTIGTRIFFALGPPDVKLVTPYIQGYPEATFLLDAVRGEAILSSSQVSKSRYLKTHMYKFPEDTPLADPRYIFENSIRKYGPNQPKREQHFDRVQKTRVDDEPGPSSPPPD